MIYLLDSVLAERYVQINKYGCMEGNYRVKELTHMATNKKTVNRRMRELDEIGRNYAIWAKIRNIFTQKRQSMSYPCVFSSVFVVCLHYNSK